MSRLGPMSLAPLLRRFVTALIAVVVGAFGSMTVLVATAAPADAWTDGACPTAAGVTVVIDFQDLGGGIWVRCAPGVVDSGFQALDQAGIPWTPTVRFSGFVCRINDKPSAGGTTMADGSTLRDPCVTTPPTEAYWSYWSATRGGSWCYSSWGGASRNPPEGTVEGWSFSYKRTASSSPPPRVTPPPAVPGSPTRLSSTDCDSPATAPTSPTNTAPPPTPSTTRAPSGGAGTGILGGFGHLILIKAYEYAPASRLAPFSYSQLIWVVIIGFIFFSEFPDAWSIAGIATLVGSGIYIARRQRLAPATTAPTQPPVNSD